MRKYAIVQLSKRFFRNDCRGHLNAPYREFPRAELLQKYIFVIGLFLAACSSFALASKEAGGDNEVIVLPKEEFDIKGLKDPFEDPFEDTAIPDETIKIHQLTTENIPLPPLEVQGIIMSGKFNQAIINNKIIKVGDSIGGARVTNISNDSVVVFFGNKSYTLYSPAALIRQGLKKDLKGGGNEKY